MKDNPFIAALRKDAERCEREEDAFRRGMNAKVAALAEARAFANRRMNVVISLFDAVQSAEDEEQAVARAVATLRDRLGWQEDSPARDEVLAEYAKVAKAAFAASCFQHESDAAPPKRRARGPDAAKALASFEAWYWKARGKPFWVLFEHYMPETQLVDF